MCNRRYARGFGVKLNGRHTVLYRRYADMRSRCKGTGATRNPEIYTGLACEFATFAEFRAFAIANGFSKHHNSPDRIDTRKGYTRDNLRFIDIITNTHAPLKNRNNSDVPF